MEIALAVLAWSATTKVCVELAPSGTGTAPAIASSRGSAQSASAQSRAQVQHRALGLCRPLSRSPRQHPHPALGLRPLQRRPLRRLDRASASVQSLLIAYPLGTSAAGALSAE